MLGEEKLQKVFRGEEIDLVGLRLDDLEFVESIYREMYNSNSNGYLRPKFMNLLQRVCDYRREIYVPKCGCCGKNLNSGNHAYMEITDIVKEQYLTLVMIYCEDCAKNERSGKMLYGVEHQFNWRGFPVQDPHQLRYMKNGCLLVFTRMSESLPGGNIRLFAPRFDAYAYTDGGSISFKLNHFTNSMALYNPEMILDMMWEIEYTNRFVCTSCGYIFSKDKIGGYPLFAGRVCPDCWKEHLIKLDDEVKKGHVCRNCRRPYGDCCC